jgi:hypothetical protein
MLRPMRSASRIVRFGLGFVAAVSLTVFTGGCSAITDTQLPDGVIGPKTYNNREGATRLTQAAREALSTAIRGYIVSSGLLTDELTASGNGEPNVGYGSRDQRSGHWSASAGGPPHTVRALARLARGIVGKYVPGETSAWQAQLLLYEAYAEILTADGWCSGVPLSTLDFEGDWTYKPGSTTDEIYAHAIQLLDSAELRASDSVRLQSAIRVVKARAHLALGQYAEARQAVQGLDGNFQYTMRLTFDDWRVRTRYNEFVAYASVSDQEGINGLPYRSSRDPRTTAIQLTNASNALVWFPARYVATDSSTFVLASGIEAQLILAEAAFQEHDPDGMLMILNALRTSGMFTVDTTQLSGGGERIDTLWQAGLGGIAGLRPLPLPATPEAQRQRLFAERAAWLFVTGSRQGDLRRLVRRYGVDREQIYPTGRYTGPGYTGTYGTDISFGLNQAEFINPLFQGCRYDD